MNERMKGALEWFTVDAISLSVMVVFIDHVDLTIKWLVGLSVVAYNLARAWHWYNKKEK